MNEMIEIAISLVAGIYVLLVSFGKISKPVLVRNKKYYPALKYAGIILIVYALVRLFMGEMEF